MCFFLQSSVIIGKSLNAKKKYIDSHEDISVIKALTAISLGSNRIRSLNMEFKNTSNDELFRILNLYFFIFDVCGERDY